MFMIFASLISLGQTRELGLAEKLTVMQSSTRTCVTSLFAAGNHDRVHIAVTCGEQTILSSESPQRESISSATSLVTERFAELGFTTSCQATSTRRPFSGRVSFGSVLCIHQR